MFSSLYAGHRRGVGLYILGLPSHLKKGSQTTSVASGFHQVSMLFGIRPKPLRDSLITAQLAPFRKRLQVLR